MHSANTIARRTTRGTTLGAMLALMVALGGCNILDVSNPNNVNEEALSDPAAAPSEVNGEVAQATKGIIQVLAFVETVSDNMTWIGSLDGMHQLDLGFVRDPYNEFVVDADIGMNPARWLANKTVQRMEAFDAAGQLTDRTLLARANLFDAIVYDYIANYWDDFVIASDRAQAGAPVGHDKMVTLYDSALAALDRALPIAQAAANNELTGQILGMRARARFDRHVWTMLNPSGTAPSQPLVQDAQMAADATAALQALGSDAYRFQLRQDAGGLGIGNCDFASCTNSRQEIRFAPSVATYNYQTKKLTVALQDPIDGIPDPVIASIVQEFVDGTTRSPVTILSSRQLLLLLAEDALARGATTEFQTYINRVRALDGLTAYSGQIPAVDMLLYERRVNLYLQGQRLADMYRFGIQAPEWAANSDAATCPGSFFPIGNVERMANPNVTDTPGCGQ